MDLELVSFKLCPFVQRAVITLRYKNVPFRLTHIDLEEPPAWFRAISPFGKVPLLKVGGEVLFESAVINEYLDETTPGRLHPEDPLRRALNRAWIEFGSACIMDLHQLSVAPTEAGFAVARDALLAKLDRLEDTLGSGPWFNGEAFSLVDTAYAPFLMRLDLLDQAHGFLPPERHPKTRAWGAALVEHPAVHGSVAPDFVRLYLDYLRAKGGYFATFLAGA